MAEVAVYPLPTAPRWLRFADGISDPTYMRGLAGFLHVCCNGATLLVPLAAQVDLCLAAGEHNLLCALQAGPGRGQFCVCIPTDAASQTVSVDTLTAAFATCTDRKSADRASHLRRCVRGNSARMLQAADALLTWAKGPARSLPMAAYRKRTATAAGAIRYQRVGGYLVSDVDVLSVVPNPAPRRVGLLSIARCPRLHARRLQRAANGTLSARLPARISDDRDPVYRCRSDIRQIMAHVATQALGTAPSPLAVDGHPEPRTVLYGVRVMHLPVVLGVYGRYSEKKGGTFSKTPLCNGADVHIAGHLLWYAQQNRGSKKDRDTVQRYARLAQARGHSLTAALRHYDALAEITGDAYPFAPGTPFRAPSTKRLLRIATHWGVWIKRRRSARVGIEEMEKQWTSAAPVWPTLLRPPFAMVSNVESADWNSDVDYRSWIQACQTAHVPNTTVPMPPLAPLALVWEPKIDGWRVLLHWDGRRLSWFSNTGRLLCGGARVSRLPGDIHRQVEASCVEGRCPAFILDCELTAGATDATTTAELQGLGAGMVAVPRRTRASAVRKLGAVHTLFVMDCIFSGSDVSCTNLGRRRRAAAALVKTIGLNGSMLAVRLVPQQPVPGDDHSGEIPPAFVAAAFPAMVSANMEGIVVKLTSLAYGGPHTVLKPVYYITDAAAVEAGRASALPAAAALPLPEMLRMSQRYARVVYMGCRTLGHDPWLEPVFGVKGVATPPYRPGHPWHNYVPIHVEGFKTAHILCARARVSGLPHSTTHRVTRTASHDPGMEYLLHRPTAVTPTFQLFAEQVYLRQNTTGWSFPYRLYLIHGRLGASPVDTATELEARFSRLPHLGR